MSDLLPLTSALLSAHDKSCLLPLASRLQALGVELVASGGTARFLREQGLSVREVSEQTGYPAILGGRVKTLHPAVFGGILANRDLEEHQRDLQEHNLPAVDLVAVDLYPFEETLRSTDDPAELIEQIDIGGISLIRAAAKNHAHVWVLPSSAHFEEAADWLTAHQAGPPPHLRKQYAARAFALSSHYDGLIAEWLTGQPVGMPLRYGENPHQKARFEGHLEELVEQQSGKELSYNNLLDVDAAVRLIREADAGTLAIFKHTIPCGMATRPSPLDAWDAALAGDPVSAFGGIIVTNHEVDLPAAKRIHEHFYEVLIAPSFTGDALKLLKEKEKRILLRLKDIPLPAEQRRSLLNGSLVQEADMSLTDAGDYEYVTSVRPPERAVPDLCFAELAAKHLKSNAIALVRDCQLIGAGVGQPSRIDALNQAIAKARRFEFSLEGAVLASDGFFPFSDGVQTAHEAGIQTFLQPGGSRRDQESVEYCDQHSLGMIFTHSRHFRH